MKTNIVSGNLIPAPLDNILLHLPQGVSDAVVERVNDEIPEGDDVYQWYLKIEAQLETRHPHLFEDLENLRHFEDGVRARDWGDTVLYLYALLDAECRSRGVQLPQGKKRTCQRYLINYFRASYPEVVDGLISSAQYGQGWFGERVRKIVRSGHRSQVVLAVIKMCLVFDHDALFNLRRQEHTA